MKWRRKYREKYAVNKCTLSYWAAARNWKKTARKRKPCFCFVLCSAVSCYFLLFFAVWCCALPCSVRVLLCVAFCCFLFCLVSFCCGILCDGKPFACHSELRLVSLRLKFDLIMYGSNQPRTFERHHCVCQEPTARHPPVKIDTSVSAFLHIHDTPLSRLLILCCDVVTARQSKIAHSWREMWIRYTMKGYLKSNTICALVDHRYLVFAQSLQVIPTAPLPTHPRRVDKGTYFFTACLSTAFPGIFHQLFYLSCS